MDILSKKEGSSIRCLACAHKCLIPEGKTGICGVRKNSEGKLDLLVYGKAAAVHTDPIEKKPLYHFLPGSQVFSIGTVGCNFRCSFCQNWGISQERSIAGRPLIPKDVKKESNGVPIIAYTYNEPTVFFEYARDIAKANPDKRHVFVSNGYMSDEAIESMDFVDAINIDLKSFSDSFYKKNCNARLEPVLNSIKRLHTKGAWVEVTTLLIPGENDSDQELKDIACFIKSIDKEIPWHISGFHPDFKMLKKPSTSLKSLQGAFDIARSEGLSYVYLGNIRSDNSTFCPKCQGLLVIRSGFSVSTEGLKEGRCVKCGYRIKGVWS